MKRKIIKQGAATLTVSLPSKWTKRHNLKGGDEINVDESDKALVISTEKEFVSKKSEIDISKLDKKFIWIYLIDIYNRGDDEVTIRFEDPKVVDLINKITKELIGFAIVEQGSNYCKLKDLSGSVDTDIDTIMRRAFLLIIMMAEDGFEVLKNKDVKNFVRVAKRDWNVNKFISFCLRNLSKKGYSDFHKTLHLYNILILLEHLGDEYSRLFYYLTKPVCKDIVNMYERVVKINKDFYKLFYKFDLKLAESVVNQREKIRGDTDKLLLKLRDTNEVQSVYRIRKIAELIWDMEKIQIGMFI